MTSTFGPWPFFTDEEILAATGPLKSGKVNYWTGTEGTAFENEFANFCGVDHAVAVVNGTVALELALQALDIGPGDEVITSCYTFIASASAIVMRGATPVLVDINPHTLNISAESIRPHITNQTKGIIVVHLAGLPCDMDPILDLARQHGLKVIEDCAQAHGATYKGRPVGSLGDAAAFSFCQDKIMTTGGEGGMLTTNNEDAWKRAWAFKDHGKNFVTVYNKEHPPGFRWLHESFGTNWRMTEMQAAIGRIQLHKLPEWLRKRRENAGYLDKAFKSISALAPRPTPPYCEHAFYKYYVFVRPERLKENWNRDRIMAAINAEGVPCYSGSCSEIYLEKAFIDAGLCPKNRLPNAKRRGENSLMFLVHPTLTQANIEATVSAVKKVMLQASI